MKIKQLRDTASTLHIPRYIYISSTVTCFNEEETALAWLHNIRTTAYVLLGDEKK